MGMKTSFLDRIILVIFIYITFGSTGILKKNLRSHGFIYDLLIDLLKSFKYIMLIILLLLFISFCNYDLSNFIRKYLSFYLYFYIFILMIVNNLYTVFVISY